MVKRLALMLALVGCTLAAAPAAATALPGSIAVSGVWIPFDFGTETCTPHGPHVFGCTVTGFSTAYTGDLIGSSSAEFVEIVNCKTGKVQGHGTDTFTGSVTGVGSGTLTWRIHFSATVGSDCETLTSFEGRGVIVGGTGDLAGLRGTLEFAFDLTYTGRLH
jgi:hypothetical protein